MNQNPNTFRLIRALVRTMRKTKWFVYSDGLFRSNRQCPMTFLGNIKGSSTDDAFRVGARFGFSDELIETVMFAADNNPIQNQKTRRMRKILLRVAEIKK